MRYLHSYRFVFNSPNWALNLLFVMLCLVFIPVVGQIVAIGYFFEMIEYMHRRGSDGVYPDFKFERFVKYLTRGLWPFLAEFLISMILLPVIGVGYFAIVFMWIFASEKKFPVETAAIATVAIVLVAAAVMLATALVRLPIYLKSGLQQEFAAGFSLSFFRDIYSRIGWTIFVTLLFEMVSALALTVVGLLLFIVGVYPAAALVAYAQHHLLYQLYGEYLKAGGMPIPLKPEDRAEPDYGEEIVEDPGRAPE